MIFNYANWRGHVGVWASVNWVASLRRVNTIYQTQYHQQRCLPQQEGADQVQQLRRVQHQLQPVAQIALQVL